jgi:DNA-binding CsgD family transcriptional regulator
VPLRDRQSGLDNDFRGAIVFLIDPDQPCSITTEGMDVLYQLTSAEAETLALSVNGRSTSEISEIRDVATETVRTQVKSILAKIGAPRREELVRLATTVNPPVLPRPQ